MASLVCAGELLNAERKDPSMSPSGPQEVPQDSLTIGLRPPPTQIADMSLFHTSFIDNGQLKCVLLPPWVGSARPGVGIGRLVIVARLPECPYWSLRYQYSGCSQFPRVTQTGVPSGRGGSTGENRYPSQKGPRQALRRNIPGTVYGRVDSLRGNADIRLHHRNISRRGEARKQAHLGDR
jgi:hypothetical protein